MQRRGWGRVAAVAGMGMVFVAALCAVVALRGSGGSNSSLLELGAGPTGDLRKALALEVSKKRFNKAQKYLESVHYAMKEDFVELKEWSIKKEEARAQLQNVLAEYSPNMKIDESSTAEYSQKGSKFWTYLAVLGSCSPKLCA